MNPGLRAIETTGVVETRQQLKLDIPLPASLSSRVRIIVLFPEETYQEPSEAEWLYAAATNPAFDFLKEPTEDIYTLADGRPFDDLSAVKVRPAVCLTNLIGEHRHVFGL